MRVEHNADTERARAASELLKSEKFNVDKAKQNVAFHLNWSDGKSGCNNLVSTIPVKLDTWVDVGFRLDNHATIFQRDVGEDAISDGGKYAGPVRI